MKTRGVIGSAMAAMVAAMLSSQPSSADESIREIFLAPATREYLALAEEAADCFGLTIQLYPGFLEAPAGEPSLSDILPFDLAKLLDDDPVMASFVGEGRRYEMAFEHGDLYEGEGFVEMASMILMWNFFTYANLAGAHAIGDVSDEHYRLFRDRRANRFSLSLGFALAGSHERIHQRFSACVANPFASGRLSLEGEVFDARMASYLGLIER